MNTKSPDRRRFGPHAPQPAADSRGRRTATSSRPRMGWPRSSATSSTSRDVVLLDLVMRGMYGLEVLQKLRELDADGADRGRVGRHPDLVAGSGRRGGRQGVRQQAVRQERDSRRARRRPWQEPAGEADRPASRTRSIELINIGFGRAAAALSKLTGHRVQLEVPQITMCPIDEMADRLRPLLDNDVATRPPDLLRPGGRRCAARPRSAAAPRFSRSC